jgi:hypothetical protein
MIAKKFRLIPGKQLRKQAFLQLNILAIFQQKMKDKIRWKNFTFLAKNFRLLGWPLIFLQKPQKTGTFFKILKKFRFYTGFD